MNENDLESPGYEYLRSYQSMANLHLKLIALNYRTDFCSLYKCPPIHKYYFSIPRKNHSEQQFMFICLSSWLIKHKCQMNLELEPEEYEDPSNAISIIDEAIRLLVIPDEDLIADSRVIKGFQAVRLKRGYGPEVIWVLNILADRALELTLDDELVLGKKAKIIFNSKGLNEPGKGPVSSRSITIGQPFVGGGLTTRPLGNYQIDDSSLLFDEDQTSSASLTALESLNKLVDPDEWYNEVERVRPILDEATTNLTEENDKFISFENFLKSLMSSKQAIHEFKRKSASLLDMLVSRIDRQMQVIKSREKFIRSNMSVQVEEFMDIWRKFSNQLEHNKQLNQQVESKTDKFESFNNHLKEISNLTEARIRELSDGTKLKELEVLITKLNEENAEFDMKIGLLLIVYSKVQTKVVSQSNFDS